MPPFAGNKRPWPFRLRSHDANCIVCDLDTLRQSAQVIPPIAAVMAANALPRAARKPFDHCRARGAVAGAFEQRLRPVGVSPGLIAENLETGDPLVERRVVQIGDAGLDGVAESLEARFRFGRLPLQASDVSAAALGLILAASKDAAKLLLQLPRRIH